MAELAKYKYLGLSTVVQVDYPEPDIKLDLWGGTVGQYDGLDRFGRVVDHRWIDYSANPDADVSRIQYGYDRNSNRLWRQNDVARAASKKFDQAYSYDGLNRLTDFQRGLLDGNHAIPSNDLTFRQNWGLDAVGNWSCFNQDDDGDGTYDLKQQRTANEVNEITDITETTGPSWAIPSYNPVGNTTAFPNPSDLTSNYTAEFDAWNRLVRVKDGANNVQENEFDGGGYRIARTSYSAGAPDQTRHFYFTVAWQVIEQRSDGANDADHQFFWGVRNIDDIILRDRDSTANGTLDERLYALNDGQRNVTTIMDSHGDVQQRYQYQAYGKPAYLSPTWGSSSSASWECLFASYPFDIELQLYHVRRRCLHSELGRWLQRDPLGLVDATSVYEYVSSNPLVSIDSSGSTDINSAEPSASKWGGMAPDEAEKLKRLEGEAKARTADPINSPPLDPKTAKELQRLRDEFDRLAAKSRGNCWRFATGNPMDEPLGKEPSPRQHWHDKHPAEELFGRITEHTCKELMKRVTVAGVATTPDRNGQCIDGSYLIAVMVKPGGPSDGDFHIVRQFRTPWGFIHKAGKTGVVTGSLGTGGRNKFHMRFREGQKGFGGYTPCGVLCICGDTLEYA